MWASWLHSWIDTLRHNIQTIMQCVFVHPCSRFGEQNKLFFNKPNSVKTIRVFCVHDAPKTMCAVPDA